MYEILIDEEKTETFESDFKNIIKDYIKGTI